MEGRACGIKPKVSATGLLTVALYCAPVDYDDLARVWLPRQSIRERVYALPDIGCGILLYTGGSDAEGTLGGLVEVGRRIADILRSALELGALCSNDPICAQHDAENPYERRFLLGAACHGCLLISETSCEQQNELLDRALVVRTVSSQGAEFFTA